MSTFRIFFIWIYHNKLSTQRVLSFFVYFQSFHLYFPSFSLHAPHFVQCTLSFIKLLAKHSVPQAFSDIKKKQSVCSLVYLRKENRNFHFTLFFIIKKKIKIINFKENWSKFSKRKYRRKKLQTWLLLCFIQEKEGMR